MMLKGRTKTPSRLRVSQGKLDTVKARLPEPCATSSIVRFYSERREVRKKDLWVIQLTGWRKPQGTRACWKHEKCSEDA
jgi:hypothetical protein